MFRAVLLIFIYIFLGGLSLVSLIFGGGVMAQARGVVILFDALHVIGVGVMAQAWGVVISPELGNCSGFEGGEIIGGVHPHGVGCSGEWGRVSPGPEPQQIGKHV